VLNAAYEWLCHARRNYDIDGVEILAFTGDGIDVLRQIIKDQIDRSD
jgi:hypothetical protein